MSLKESLSEFFGEKERRAAIVGIGSEIRGDEAAGLLIVEDLRNRDLSDTLVLNTGTRPENFTGDIRKFKPTHILMIEAAHFDGEPGEGRLIPTQELKDEVITHNTPLTIFKDYMEKTLCSNVAFLGIQYTDVNLGDPTPQINEASKGIAETIYQVLS